MLGYEKIKKIVGYYNYNCHFTIKEKLIIYGNERVIERVMRKKLDKPLITQDSLIIADLSQFLYNLRDHIQEFENHENIIADGITYLEEYK